MRNPVFDVAKFLLMLLVIQGHLGGIVAGSDFGQPYYSNFKDGCAMPLFFVMSGFFAAKTIESRDVVRWISKISGLLWPLVSFGAVFGVLMFCIGGAPLWKMLLYPINYLLFGGWFLQTLAVVYFIVALIWKVTDSFKWRMFLLLLAYAALMCLPRTGAAFLYADEITHMFPYFVFGLVVLRKFRLWESSVAALICGAIFLGVAFVEGNISTNGMSFYQAKADWRELLSGARGAICFFGRTIVGITGSVFALWVVGMLIKAFPSIGRLGCCGTTTLGVYVMHGWILAKIRGIPPPSQLPAWSLWPLTIFVFFICHYLTVVLRNSRANALFFGNEKWLAERLRCVKVFAKISN